MKDNNRVSPDPYQGANSYHFQNPSLSCEQAHTLTRSRDVRFSKLERRRENGVILLTLFVVGHDSGSKNQNANDEQEMRENENDLL